MKWAFGIQQKIKVALLLAFLMLIILVVNLVERRNVFNLHASFTSIYNDRLIPASDIHTISENLYKKRLLIEMAMFHDNPNLNALEDGITSLNQENDSLITAFKATYLVDAELVSLDTLQINIARFNLMEEAAISLLKSGETNAAKGLYENKCEPVFMATVKLLSHLVAIQTEVGKELLAESKQISSNSKLLSSVQVALVIVLGIIIQILIMASRTANVRKPQGFELN